MIVEEKPSGGIVLEDFRGGDGFYKVNLAYLNKEQVEEIENIVNKWNTESEESKDEKIRKECISIIDAWDKSCRLQGDYCEVASKCIAWLEKQGEQQSTYSEEDENIRKELTEFLNDASGGFLNSTIKCKTFGKWATWLEKQSKQKNPCETCEEPRLNCQNFPCDRKKNFDSINKVEPKFKVGDIIKPKDGGHEPWQIMQVDMFDKKYRFKDGCVVHFSQEDNYELIEQNPIDDVEPKFKYGDRVRNKISGLEQTLGSCIGDIYEGAFPFFVKDQDDWELVKQNPTDKNELKKIDTYCQENCKGYQETGRCFFDEECKAKKEYMKQKHTKWNEEDEGFFNLLLAIFNTSHPNGIFTTGDIAPFNGACITSNKIINWFKSIKDRAQLKHEWSQDDKDYYDAIIAKLEVTQDDALLTNNQMNFLRSLKDKI